MHRFSKCPRCKGKVVLEKDRFGWYQQCLQCGHLRDLGTVVLLQGPPSDLDKVPESVPAPSGRQQGKAPDSRRGHRG